MKKRLFVIDGHALCYRAYFAFIKNPLTNSKGQNTSAIFGFARMLFKLVADQKPDYLVVAFDPPKKSFRFALYPEYKANREKMPDDLRSQIEEIKLMVGTLGIRRIEEADYEADDVLGTIARAHASSGLEVVLVTGDKDAYQLVDDNTSIYANKKGITEFETYDAEAVRGKLGISPSQVVDYMALVGDASDNIPGVRGIGEKTALKLIQEHGSLDNVYANLGSIKGKLRQTLEANREMAYLCRDLVTIRTGLSIAFNIEEARTPDFHSIAARAFFRSHEMESIARDLTSDDTASGAPGTPAAAREDRDYRIVRSAAELAEAIAQIRKAGAVAVDTETTSVNPVAAGLVGISLSVRENAGWYIPVQNLSLFSEECIDRSEALALLKPVLEDPSIRKIGQNIKYDIIIFRNAGIDIQGVYFDTMIASYLLDPSERRHNMDDMAMKFLNYKTTTFKELVSKGKDTLSITEVPLRELADYAVEDADITLRLYRILSTGLAGEGLDRLFHDVEMPLAGVLARMELSGVKIDLQHFKALSKENQRLLDETEERIHKAAGARFNINSTRELAGVLFDKLGLKPVKKTKTGFSTDIQVLETLQGSHPVVDDLIAYRTFAKLKSTYIDSLPGLVLPSTGRIHTSFNQTVVATGRLSSSDPNLQNIPVRDEFGKKIRRGFVPDTGMILLSADYSQIELRLAAHLSGDEQMTEAFKNGIDIHSLTASSVFRVAMDAITPDMRRQAKVINFATIYGVSPYGLSQQAGISVRDAAEFINRYFATYPGFRRYIDETIAFAREKGYVLTILGRRRPIPEINSSAQFRREGAERIAINTPIQGTAADLVKIAMIDVQREIDEKSYGGRMILQVHDELVFEVPLDEKERFGAMVRAKMEGALKLSVPIVVDMGWGTDWGEAH
ncbi:MAG TPA: DNA polymerase I [Spirochaetota bacterium]|nr:DNA polymerase I [Spirochaetota bacterium]